MGENGGKPKGPYESLEKAPSDVNGNPEEALVKNMLDTFPSTVTDFKVLERGTVRVKVERRDLYRLCKHLRDNLGFEHISMISAVDYEDRFEMVYHITSYAQRLLVETITALPRDDPSVDSVSSIWGGADWQERETYDLMGIKFNNHPKLERILLPRDYLFHPLRKDFKGGP